jgi:hypothetical protein
MASPLNKGFKEWVDFLPMPNSFVLHLHLTQEEVKGSFLKPTKPRGKALTIRGTL